MGAAAAKKRKLEDAGDDGVSIVGDRPNKKRATAVPPDDDVIILEDDGAITID